MDKNKSVPFFSTAAIVVTFHPQADLLDRLLDACLNQVNILVLVDNGSDEVELAVLRNLSLSRQFTLIELGENLGIAAAQNRGITFARSQGYSHLLFFDQDSVPAPDLVQKLHTALAGLSANNQPVAAVGPRLVDRRTLRSTPFVRFNWFGVTRKHCTDDSEDMQQTDFLVSSGMLIPITAFDHVGQMEEGLFIDNVDMEWCFRARSMGFLLYGICSAVMQHSVGDQVFRIGPGVLHRHSPVRQYYIMRNRLLLYRRSYTPKGWIVQDSLRALFKLLAFSIVFAPRLKNLQMIYCGIRDAFSGITGRYRA